jgi:hypothetical protein
VLSLRGTWAAAVALTFAVADPLRAAEIVPTLTAGMFYTDNVLLAPPGEESDDIIGLVQPGIRILSSGQRYDLQLDYRLQAVFYNDQSDSDSSFSIGRARLTGELLPERLLITGVAGISQTVIDPQQVVPANNLPITANRQDQVELRVTPEWRQNLGNADLRLAYTAGKLAFESDTLQDVDFSEFDNSLTGPDRERGLTWALKHFYGAYDYSTVEIKRQTVDLFLFAEVGNGWAPFLSVGVESDFAEPTKSDLDYFTWSVGLRRSTEFTRAEVSFGDRSFGSNVNVLLERQIGARDGDYIRATYSEAPRTPANLVGVRAPPPGEVLPGPPGSIDPEFPVDEPPVVLPPGVGQSFLSRRGQFIMAKEFIQSTLSLTLFAEDFKSVPFGVDVSEATTKTTQYGAIGRYSYRFGQRLSMTATLRVANREFETDDVVTSADDLLNGRVSLNYELGEKTSLKFVIGTDRQENAKGAALNREYEQNIVGVTVTRSFL